MITKIFSRSRVLIAGVIWLLVVIPLGHTFTVGGLEFADEWRRDGVELPLRGAGLKKFLTIRVVAVGLYLPRQVEPADVLSEIPKHLEVIYLQNIPALELHRATIKGIRNNVSKKEFEQLQPLIEQINAYFPDVKRMDRIQVTYIPGQGTEVAVNGVFQGVVPGAELGRAFFAIWVGDVPVDPRMKQVLLGTVRQQKDEI